MSKITMFPVPEIPAKTGGPPKDVDFPVFESKNQLQVTVGAGNAIPGLDLTPIDLISRLTLESARRLI
jgi:hypothetical protein